MNLVQNSANHKTWQHQYFPKLFHETEKKEMSSIIFRRLLLTEPKKSHRTISFMNIGTIVLNKILPSYNQEHIKMSFIMFKLTSFQECRMVTDT